jgi:multidrug efflux system outer membrane protein
MRDRAVVTGRALLVWLFFGVALQATVHAQAIEAISFDEAIRRAIANNPTIRQAAAGILRAEAILQQTRALSLPSLNATLATNVIGPVPSFAGQNIVPRTQLTTSAVFAVPVLQPVLWAQRNQAADQVIVFQRDADDIRRQIAVATAEAYLAILTQKRQLELNERARDNAKAHFDYAEQRYQGGLGSRLNALRAQQALSTDEARVEVARFTVVRAQEALGVLVGSNMPVDAAGDPSFVVPPGQTPDRDLLQGRTDVRLVISQESAAQRVLDDSWREYLPSVTTLFAPQVLTPSGLFAQPRSWSLSFVGTIPIFEFGERRGRQRERRAIVDSIRAERENLEREASSEVRTAREAVSSSERALDRARAAAEQALEVLRITDIAFREGATTNIEVIDAQREARDTDTGRVIAEDAVRRAQLDLLVAMGRFP